MAGKNRELQARKTAFSDLHWCPAAAVAVAASHLSNKTGRGQPATNQNHGLFFHARYPPSTTIRPKKNHCRHCPRLSGFLSPPFSFALAVAQTISDRGPYSAHQTGHQHPKKKRPSKACLPLLFHSVSVSSLSLSLSAAQAQTDRLSQTDRSLTLPLSLSHITRTHIHTIPRSPTSLHLSQPTSPLVSIPGLPRTYSHTFTSSAASSLPSPFFHITSHQTFRQSRIGGD